jgi:hypothetical protein
MLQRDYEISRYIVSITTVVCCALCENSPSILAGLRNFVKFLIAKIYRPPHIVCVEKAKRHTKNSRRS